MMFGIPRTAWAVNASLHPRWKAKEGDRWFIQLWHPTRGFMISHRGWRIVVIR